MPGRRCSDRKSPGTGDRVARVNLSRHLRRQSRHDRSVDIDGQIVNDMRPTSLESAYAN